ncbi:MAG: hypothetical protein V3W34_16830 [Phycisphaerae bacterium]
MRQPQRERIDTIMAACRQSIQRVRYVACILMIVPALHGCVVGAGAQLAAADSLDALVQNLDQAAGEYHSEVRTADAARRQSAVAAFVTRIRNSQSDEDAAERDVAEFIQALDRLLQDGDVETVRYNAVADNLQIITEIADGLRRLAGMSLTVQNQTRQRLHDLLSGTTRQPRSMRNR